MGELMNRCAFWLCATLAAVCVMAMPATAATQYTYDSQGRLILVVYDNGDRIAYEYDDAGNRKEVRTNTGTNLPPVANTSPVTITVTEGGAEKSVGTPLAKFTDPNGGTKFVAGATDGARGTVAWTTSTVKYTVRPGVSGPSTDSFVYSVRDSNDAYGTVVVVVTINNAAPNAVNDSFSVPKNTWIDYNVVANDTDPGLDAVRITSVSNPPHGSAFVYSPGVIRYTPDANYTGSDSFTYTLTDEDGASDNATVNVTVTTVNGPPNAEPDSITVALNTPRTFDPRSNDSDPDGNALTITGKTNGSHGTVTFTSTSVTYTPTTGYTGSDNFTYTISDGAGGTDTAYVVVLVRTNSAPDAVNDTLSAVLNTASVFDPRVNDTDADNELLAITAASTPSHGTASVTNNGTRITYTPTTGYTGSDSFTYTIADGAGATDTATVSVTVSGSNSPPDAVNDTLEATGPFGQSAVGSTDVLANDSDPNGQALTIISTTNGTKGTTGFVGGVITYTTNTGSSVGTDSFTYTISDGAGGTDTATVSVTISRE